MLLLIIKAEQLYNKDENYNLLLEQVYIYLGIYIMLRSTNLMIYQFIANTLY
jgi:hypothetical protein